MRVKAVAVLTLLILSISSASAATQKVLYTFTGGLDGGGPYSGVIFDSAGNLYGVTQDGGTYGRGTVFQLTRSGSDWTETVLYSFTGGLDGFEPIGGLAIDDAGNLYGTTANGGDPLSGCGTLFKLVISTGTLTNLHTFTGGKDGCGPGANLRLSGGSLAGTTVNGGAGAHGTAFSLLTSGAFYSVSPFLGNKGREPWGGVNVWRYGTTYSGGKNGGGNVFELTFGHNTKAVHVFNPTSKGGYHPLGDLLTQNLGGVPTMYGTTFSGAVGNRGTAYRLKLSPTKSDVWLFSVLYSFSGLDGGSPGAGLIADPAGNLYGTTMFGGPDNSGTVFKLTPAPKTWPHFLLYAFTGGDDGGEVTSGVVSDDAGNLYGTTLSGGAFNKGVVYEITP